MLQVKRNLRLVTEQQIVYVPPLPAFFLLLLLLFILPSWFSLSDCPGIKRIAGAFPPPPSPLACLLARSLVRVALLTTLKTYLLPNPIRVMQRKRRNSDLLTCLISLALQKRQLRRRGVPAPIVVDRGFSGQ